jgi:hypothetical protein
METEPLEPAPFNVTEAPEDTVCDRLVAAIVIAVHIAGNLD